MIRKVLMIAGLTLFGIFLLAVATPQALIEAQAGNEVHLVPGDTLRVNCEGRKLTDHRVNARTMTLKCKGKAAAPSVVKAMANGEVDLVRGDTLRVNCHGGKLTDHRQSKLTMTLECKGPTDTVPLCPDHDPTKWHALYDNARKCHYDHTHNADPNTPAAVAIFGTAGAQWGGQQISYPWATSSMENGMKHGGYKYAVRLGIPCDETKDFNGYKPVNCIKDARIEYHTVSGSMDSLARFHSFYLEFNVCARSNLNQCGLIRYGGWMDIDLKSVV